MKYLTLNKIIFIPIIFLIKLNINIKCKIVFPIETLSLDNYINSYNTSHQRLIKNSLCKNIYTYIEIGTPIQKIPLFINTREYFFEITSFSSENPNKYKLRYNLSSIFNMYDFFHENFSSSFRTEGCIQSNNIFSDHFYDCFSYDKINLKNNLGNNIEIKNFEFNMVKGKEDNITGVLGLGLFDNSEEINKGFLKILKNKGVINEFYWYFLFNSSNDINGKLILGSLPHEDFPDIFSKDDLIYTYIPNVDYSFSNNYYKIRFNEIYTKSLDKSIYIKLLNIDAELDFFSDTFIAPKEFEIELRKKFLKNFEISEKCFKDSIQQDIYYTDLKFYFCDINIKNELYDILPFIKFISKDLNYTFEITKEELFQIEGNYIYLNILFDYGKSYWVLGKPFSLKYQFVFDQDSKKIGLYKNVHKKIYIKNNDKKSHLDKITKIFIIIAFSLCLIFLGFYLGKKIYQIKRKLRANEMDDNYEYIINENNSNNDSKDFNSNDNKFHKNENNASIEMGFKF